MPAPGPPTSENLATFWQNCRSRFCSLPSREDSGRQGRGLFFFEEATAFIQ